MKIKNIDLGKSKISIISIFFYLLTVNTVQADDLDYFGKKIDIRILDKLSSKSKLLKLDIGESLTYKNLEIKVLKKNIIRKLEKILEININDKLIEEKIYSPVDLDKNTNSYLGSLYGTSSNDMFSSFLRHPNFSRKLKNVFFCGGSVHPGGGIPLCILSSKITSELIEN